MLYQSPHLSRRFIVRYKGFNPLNIIKVPYPTTMPSKRFNGLIRHAYLPTDSSILIQTSHLLCSLFIQSCLFSGSLNDIEASLPINSLSNVFNIHNSTTLPFNLLNILFSNTAPFNLFNVIYSKTAPFNLFNVIYSKTAPFNLFNVIY